MSSATTKRSLTYWIFFLTLLMLGGPIMFLDIVISPFVHFVLDSIAAVAAFIATILVFRAHKKTKANMLAFIGIALGGATVLQITHLASCTTLITPWLKSDISLFMPWSWVTAQSILALAMLSAAPFIRRENFGEPATTEKHLVHTSKRIGFFVLFLIPIVIFILTRIDLPPIYYASVSPTRAPEIVPTLLFFVTLVTFVRKGNWRTDSYGHWLNVSLVAFLVSQTSGMAFSKELFDSSFVAAHILKILGFGFIIVGFMLPHRVSALDVDSEVSKPKGLGLNAKVAILCGVIGFICVMPVAIKSSQTLHEIAGANGMEKLSGAATNANSSVGEQRKRVDADLDYLVRSEITESIYQAEQNGGVDPESNKSQKQLTRELSRLSQNLLASDADYLSFAYIDAKSGKTLISNIQRNNSGIDTKNKLALESSEKELAQMALSSTRGQPLIRSNVFVLQDPNVSNETDEALDASLQGNNVAGNNNLQVEGTALAVYSGKSDSVIGVFVMHSDVSGAFAAVGLPNIETNLYVVNTEGRFLVHPDAAKEISMGSTTAYTLAEEFPGVDFESLQKSGSSNGQIFEQADGIEVLLGINTLAAVAENGEQLLYIFSSRRDVMEVKAAEIGHDMQLIAQINLLIAILIGWFFARRFAKPVGALSAAAAEFGRSGSVSKLPHAGYDEIGMLTKSFVDMMDEVTGQRGKLLLLAAAVESSIDSTIITTIDGQVEYVNPHYERYAGIASKELLGKNILDLHEFKENRHILHEASTKKGDLAVWIGELTTRRADGKLHDELITISPITDVDGNDTNKSVVIEDITERKSMEKNIELKSAELQRSNYDLEQFAYVASHDLKSPLRAIEVLVDWLKEDLGDFSEGDVQENLGLLVKRTNRLNRLLDDLLAYSRAGRKIGDVKKIDTKEFVEDIATLIAPPEGFVIEADDSLPTIVTHHAPLETVFRNLISNAIKHSPVPEEGRIFVSAEDRGDMVEFSVQDNGSGIPREYAEKVFKMFQTLQARDEKEGSGMGLAIVQRIIDWQGGKIWFHDGPDDKGTVFKFTWNKAPADMPELEDDDGGTVSAKALTAEDIEAASKAPDVVRNDTDAPPAEEVVTALNDADEPVEEA